MKTSFMFIVSSASCLVCMSALFDVPVTNKSCLIRLLDVHKTSSKDVQRHLVFKFKF